MICPFCKRDVPKFHPNSHIVPEWMYKNTYDEKHRMVSLNLDEYEKEIIQQGFRGSFICFDCEKRFSFDDNNGCNIVTKLISDIKSGGNAEVKIAKMDLAVGVTEVYIWGGFEFMKLQKFIFSVILRNHLWHREEQKMHLNDEHYNKIKKLYLDPITLDDTSYPIMMIKYAESWLNRAMFLPYMERAEGHRRYLFAGAGFLFIIYVSSHRKPRYLETGRLKKGNCAVVLCIPFEKSGLFEKCLPRIQEIKRLEDEKLSRRDGVRHDL